MDWRPSVRISMLTALCAVTASAVLFWFGNGLQPVWWLMWLAPIPVLIASTRLSAGRAFLIVSSALLLGELNLWPYLHDLLKLPVPVILITLLMPAVFFGLAALAYRRFAVSGRWMTACLAFPAFWTLYEYLTSVLSPHGTFGSIAYTQTDCLPILQLSSVTGLWGITFCLLLFPAVVATVIAAPATRQAKVRIAAVGATVLITVLVFGFWRLGSEQATQRALVGLISVDSPADIFPTNEQHALRLAERYAGLIRQMQSSFSRTSTDHTRLILLPEKLARIPDPTATQMDQLFRQAASDARSTIVVGFDRGTAASRVNEARVYSPAGQLQARYDKHHLLPGFEDADRPGTERTVLRRDAAAWGVQICKDLDFPQLSREYGREGVGLMIVPAWDFTVDANLHSRMAVVRGVESGFSMIRAAKQGLLTISDNRGRILAQRRTSPTDPAVLVAPVPIAHSPTLYARWGDWFAWLNAGLCGILLILRLRQK